MPHAAAAMPLRPYAARARSSGGLHSEQLPSAIAAATFLLQLLPAQLFFPRALAARALKDGSQRQPVRHNLRQHEELCGCAGAAEPLLAAQRVRGAADEQVKGERSTEPPAAPQSPA